MKKSDLWAMDEEDQGGDQESQKRRDEFITKPKNLELKQPKQEEHQQNKEQHNRNASNKNAQEPTHRFEAKPQRAKKHNQRQANNNRNESTSASNSQQSNQQESNKSRGQVVGEATAEAEGGEQTSKAKTLEEIKRDRRWKNDNKAKVVHHNRKELAAKKMSRGFF
jgi:hypothetical protein